VTRTRAPFSSISMPDAAGALSRCGSTECRADADGSVSPAGTSGNVTGNNTVVPFATPLNSPAFSCRRHLKWNGRLPPQG
jgi:hypothetical protein